jgi:hypothetical protein
MKGSAEHDINVELERLVEGIAIDSRIPCFIQFLLHMFTCLVGIKDMHETTETLP